MNVSVILCTYNRCHDLAKALHAIAASEMSEETEWEVLVVDNNCNDSTRETVGEFVRLYPGRFRYVFEGQPGKSHALNAGIREAQGNVLAFVDDDVTVDSNWLLSLTSPLTQGCCVGVGGRVLPKRDVVLPNWVRLGDRYTIGPLVIFDLGPESAPLKEPPLGTNMAFKKEVFDWHGDFRTDLGPQPGSEIRGEDSEFVLRLLAAGESLNYEPSAVVYHSVPLHRLRKEYFLDWWFDKGRSDIRTLGTTSDGRWLLGGVPLVLFRRLLVWMLKWILAPNSTAGFSSRLTAWYLAGEITECYRQRTVRKDNVSGIKRQVQGYKGSEVDLPPRHFEAGRSHEQQR